MICLLRTTNKQTLGAFARTEGTLFLGGWGAGEELKTGFPYVVLAVLELAPYMTGLGLLKAQMHFHPPQEAPLAPELSL